MVDKLKDDKEDKFKNVVLGKKVNFFFRCQGERKVQVYFVFLLIIQEMEFGIELQYVLEFRDIIKFQ